MVVAISRAEIDSLDDVALVWACVAPTIELIRGKKFSVKSGVYGQLAAGQRALVMVWVLYGHARNGMARFYGEMAYLLAEAGVWSELKAAPRFFGDEAMSRLVEEMEGLYGALVTKGFFGEAGWLRAEGFDGDGELLAGAERLDAAFRDAAPGAFRLIGQYIRDNPGEFVEIEE